MYFYVYVILCTQLFLRAIFQLFLSQFLKAYLGGFKIILFKGYILLFPWLIFIFLKIKKQSSMQIQRSQFNVYIVEHNTLLAICVLNKSQIILI